MEYSGMVLMPGGVTDLLPLEARCKRELEEILLKLFEKWGYNEVVTPTFEFYEPLAPALGKMLREQLYRFIDDRGRIVILRPDMTTPIARLVSTRLKDKGFPQRYCYVANVFRRENHAGQQREFYQAGVELIGAAGFEADAEVIGLAGEALKLAGVKEFRLVVGHADVLAGLLANSGFSEYEQEEAKIALSKKDLVRWDRLISSSNLTPAGKEILASLPYLHGGIEIVEQVEVLIRDEETRCGLERLRRIWDRLSYYGVQNHVIIDLTMLRGLNYYTGIVFEGYAPEVGYPLCGGGRYDRLFENFGFPCPATGFALNIERVLVASAKRKQVDGEKVPYFFVTGSDSEEVIKKASALREKGFSVEIEVSDRSQEDSIAYASRKGIPHILVVG